MIHPGDPRYIKHNEQLRKAELAGTQQYLTHPDEQDLRSVAWKEKFLKGLFITIIAYLQLTYCIK